MRFHAADPAVSANCPQFELLLFAAKRVPHRGLRFIPEFRGDDHVELLIEQHRRRQSTVHFGALVHPGKAVLAIQSIDFVGREIGETGEKGAVFTRLFFGVTQF